MKLKKDFQVRDIVTGSSSRMEMKKIPENGYKIGDYGFLVLIEKFFQIYYFH